MDPLRIPSSEASVDPLAGRIVSSSSLDYASQPLSRTPSQRSAASNEPSTSRRTTATQPTTEGLRLLALQGAWRTLMDRLKEYRSLGGEDLLTNASYHILALTKMRMYAAAEDELAALGPLDDPAYLQDTPQGRVSRVPFALRWLQAELPHRRNRPQETMDLLYKLLEFCGEQAEAAGEAAAAAVAGPDGALRSEPSMRTRRFSPVAPNLPSLPSLRSLTAGDHTSSVEPGWELEAMWVRRQHMVVLSLVNHHLRAKEYVVALRWLRHLLQQRPADPGLWSRAAYCQLSMGDVAAAERTFRRAEACGGGGGPAGVHLLRRNRGLLLFAQQDYAGALAEFEGVLEEDPSDWVACSNAAVCRMYACQLGAGIAGLEAGLRARPLEMLRELLLLNLASMYELTSGAAASEAKRRLASWANRAAPDDFDLSCTKGRD